MSDRPARTHTSFNQPLDTSGTNRRADTRPVMATCVICGELAEHMVREDNRVPRPMCSRCLGRIREAMVLEERLAKEESARAARKVKNKAVREARRRSRRRR